MSSIFGIFNRDGKPISPEIVQTMQDTMCYWNPDDRGTWVSGPVALGHAMLWNTPESKLEQLPASNDSLSISMDARLDNRKELLKKLNLANRPLQQVTDSELILAAYEKWGEDCPKHLLGDFAFAVWDKKNNQLFFSRDHIGIKPIYYYITKDLVLVSNLMQAFLSHPNIEKKIDEVSIARYLRGEEFSHKSTFFENIQKLSPATTMAVKTDTVTEKRYWHPQHSPAVKLDTDEDYEKKFKELLEQSVKDRLRSAYPVTSHLSGGLDSTGIAAIASRLLRKDKKKLLGINWIASPEPTDAPDYYEWSYSQRFAELAEIEHHHINLDTNNLSEIFLNMDILQNDTVDLWYEFLVRKEVRNADGRVILSGWGGDEIASSYGRGYFTELFYSGRLIKSITAFREYTNHKRYTIRQFLKAYFNVTIWQSIPYKLRCKIRKKNCYRAVSLICINDDFAAFVNNLNAPDISNSVKTVRGVQLSYLEMGYIQQRIESWAIASINEKMEYRYPLLDKRLVEFCLGIPATLFLKGNQNRYIYRQAMKNELPDYIRLNTEKDEPRRVALFHENTIKAMRHSISKIKRKSDNVVDYECLFKKLSHIQIETIVDRYERTDIVDGITRSFLLLSSSLSNYIKNSKSED